MSVQHSRGYAGDLLATNAYSLLQENAAARLVDVRTQAEWNYVGLPDLSGLDKKVVALEWQTFPSMAVNASFVERLSETLKKAGATPDDPIVFLCRSGARSRNAAIAMTAAGWSHCYNISDGFEGALDESGHRGLVSGWKRDGLPWVQS
jgi:rhodanese-related sulfurtransferase